MLVIDIVAMSNFKDMVKSYNIRYNPQPPSHFRKKVQRLGFITVDFIIEMRVGI